MKELFALIAHLLTTLINLARLQLVIRLLHPREERELLAQRLAGDGVKPFIDVVNHLLGRNLTNRYSPSWTARY